MDKFKAGNNADLSQTTKSPRSELFSKNSRRSLNSKGSKNTKNSRYHNKRGTVVNIPENENMVPPYLTLYSKFG